MVSNVRLYARLDELEDQLRLKIVPHLREATAGKNDLIFCVKEFNPFRNLKGRTDKQTEECIDLGSQILSLRSKLGEPTQTTIAERICWYCREWANTAHRHNLSGVNLAKQFLAEIENGYLA